MRDGVKRHKRYNLNWFSEDKELLLLNYCYFSTKEEKEKKTPKNTKSKQKQNKNHVVGIEGIWRLLLLFLISFVPLSLPLDEYSTPFLAAWEFFVVLCSSIELFSLCFIFGCQFRMRLVTGKDRQTKSDKRKRESKRWNWEIKLWLHI